MRSSLGQAPVRTARTGCKSHILLVDDDLHVRTLGRELLEHLGYRVTVAQEGAEAIRQYHQGGADLVLLDYHLPGMTGLEVLEALQEVDPQVRVLLVSGVPTLQEQPRLKERGAVGVLRKPFRMAELASRIQDALAAP